MKDKELEKMLCNEILHEYSSEQMDAVMDFIEETFGKGERTSDGWIVHELTSKYVHTDVVITGNDDYQHFVTCGMGARNMDCAPIEFQRILGRQEYYFLVSPDCELSLEDKGLLCGELNGITKYPFRNNTFLGPGHTINASKEFKERFGYDFFLFFAPTHELEVEDLGNVHFIPLIPIYEEEREWMVENNSFDWILALPNLDDVMCIDNQREVFIPNEQETENIDC